MISIKLCIRIYFEEYVTVKSYQVFDVLRLMFTAKLVSLKTCITIIYARRDLIHPP